MKPLQGIGLGLVFISLQANFGSYDGLPDPVGWVLILLGFYWLAQQPTIARVGAVLAGLIVGLPSIRIRGLYLAMATMAFLWPRRTTNPR